ncbi:MULTISPECIES: gas vesicle protein GvpG [Nonomuraea]|uniref:Gas vesicle protein GvpG n=1 Tax=Nonomuraea mangrovi TaxID=2316207 RepID=A0ABW4SVG5_9ACTN
MGLITGILGLPLAPLKGLIRLAEVIQEQVDRELHDPAVARRQLEEIEAAQAEDVISEEEAHEAMTQVLERMTDQSAAEPEDTVPEDAAPEDAEPEDTERR